MIRYCEAGSPSPSGGSEAASDTARFHEGQQTRELGVGQGEAALGSEGTERVEGERRHGARISARLRIDKPHADATAPD